MKICDLDHVKSISETEEINLNGGIQIEALSIVLSLGSTFALTKSYSFTFAFAPGPFLGI